MLWRRWVWPITAGQLHFPNLYFKRTANGPPFRPPDRLCHTQNLRMSDQDKKPEEQEAQAGTLLVCGATDWYSIGRTKEVRPEYPNLSVPHRLKALEVRGGRWAN